MIKIKSIESWIQEEGYFVGELATVVCLDERASSKRMNEVELATEIVESNLKNHIDTVVIKGHKDPLVQKKSLLELIGYISERNKITIETNGAHDIPEELLQDKNIFISIKPSLSRNYPFKVFEKNMLKMFKNYFWNFQLKFEIKEVDEIQKYIGMLPGLILPDYFSIILQPKVGKDDDIRSVMHKMNKIINHCFEKEVSLAYDIRVIPPLGFLLDGT